MNALFPLPALTAKLSDSARPTTGRRVAQRRLAENARNARGAALGNIVNASITTWLFYGTIPVGLIASFWLLLTGLVGWRLSIAKRVAKTRLEITKLDSLTEQLVRNAIGLGGLWGLTVAAMFGFGQSDHAIFAGMIGAGMMSAGAISYRTIGPAAMGYVLACTPGAVAGLILSGSFATYSAMGLLLCFMGVLMTSIRANAKSFGQSCLREQELNRSRNTIKLLLHDHTEQGADWLLAVDRGGRIVAPSKRFGAAAQRPLETLEGMRFVDLLDDEVTKLELRTRVRKGHSLRNHIASLTIGGERRWWSISGRPMRDGEVVFRGVITDITAQRQAEEKVSYMAHYDGLTDLPNRFMFNEHLYHALRQDERVALLFMDLDHFKAVNDTLGHGVGDKLLQGAARRMESIVGNKDMLARLGGDEFAILLTGARIETADTIAARVIDAMSKSFALGDHDVVVGTTIGIAVAPQDGDDVETLLRNADLALYAAKSAGRNRAVRYETGMDEAAQERRLIEMDLRGALGKHEMRLHYQSLVDTSTGKISGYEALVRWIHPGRGIVMPGTFIPIAEETGLIVQLGEWVIRQALQDLADWSDDLSVSINLSPAQMRSPGLISTIISAIATNRIDPARICFEITETVLMQDSDANIETLHKLRDIGVQIALDDFGTGYSSLNYLRSFPFSKIKIDRCFIDEIDSRPDCQAIVRSVVGLAQSLGMTTTAEGVERLEQVEHLRLQGCSEVQGFLYSKAVPADQLSNLRSVDPRNVPVTPLFRNDASESGGAFARESEPTNKALQLSGQRRR
jgi:diguanylate cyclase (GGDEF)-like protein/PAS domain S-box-containing protein